MKKDFKVQIEEMVKKCEAKHLDGGEGCEGYRAGLEDALKVFEEMFPDLKECGHPVWSICRCKASKNKKGKKNG